MLDLIWIVEQRDSSVSVVASFCFAPQKESNFVEIFHWLISLSSS